MVRPAQCPQCQVEVNPSAGVCPSCKVELALCGWCRDVTTLSSREGGRYLCDHCGRKGARCVTYRLGGYCNGLARAEARIPKQLCQQCTGTLFDAGKTVVAWTLIGLVGSRLKPRK